MWTQTKLIKEYVRLYKLNDKRYKSLLRDVPTQLNSKYELFNKSFEYKKILCIFVINSVR